MYDGQEVRIRVLLADDHQLLRRAMRAMLEIQGPVEVVAEASAGHEAIELTDRLKPDIVLMDVAMPGLSSVEATSQIVRRNPRIKVLIVTGDVDDLRVLTALRAGAHGYVVKRSDMNELLVAIRAVNLGNPYFGQSLAHGRTSVEYLLQTRGEGPADSLSSREREVLQFVATGYTNQEIAERLVVSVKTVEAHKTHIIAKLMAQNRTDLVRSTERLGRANPGDDDQLHPGERVP
jgi:DNA-binding NarL/FixJ family response regulator